MTNIGRELGAVNTNSLISRRVGFADPFLTGKANRHGHGKKYAG
ncbi:hypothetical protein AAZX31_14G183900 [Glycine max]